LYFWADNADLNLYDKNKSGYFTLDPSGEEFNHFKGTNISSGKGMLWTFIKNEVNKKLNRQACRHFIQCYHNAYTSVFQVKYFPVLKCKISKIDNWCTGNFPVIKDRYMNLIFHYVRIPVT